MGIDRIGSKQPPAPPASEQAGGAKPTGPRFEVSSEVARHDPAAAAGADAATAARSALDRLRAGQVDLNGYLDLKVQEATGHLSLPAAELDALRARLRERMASDPGLVELVRAATGSTPPEPPTEH